MRGPLVYYLVTLATLWLAGSGPLAQAGVGAAPVAGIVAPSPEARHKPAQRTAHAKPPRKRNNVARKSTHHAPAVQLAALSGPDLSLYPSTVLTEEEALKALEQELSLKVGKQIHPSDYPAEARRWRWTGTSVVQVQVGTDGMVRAVELQRSSGFYVLDEQALMIVRRVSKLYVPFRLRGREHAVAVPVGFYLKEI
jgi:periplasmic protein TonB